MNWSEMHASWNELSALIRAQWPKLTNVELDDIDGDRAKLARALQHHYGFNDRDAEIALCEFEEDVRRPGAVK
jgi:hypothetical protein